MPASLGSAFDVWWHNEGSGMPSLPGEDAETHVRRICKIAWNAAINAADDKAWGKRDMWGEGDGYSPTKAKAAEEIGYAIRTLISPPGSLNPTVRHSGDCSIWIGPICDCGELRRAASTARIDEEHVLDAWSKHLGAIDRARDPVVRRR